jgi:hypothetical protein
MDELDVAAVSAIIDAPAGVDRGGVRVSWLSVLGVSDPE